MSGDKGFERLTADYLNGRLPWEVDRRVKRGAKDRGDIGGIPGWAIECKNRKRMALAEWVDEARLEAENAGADFCAVVHKRRGKGKAADQYVTMTLDTLARMILASHRTP